MTIPDGQGDFINDEGADLLAWLEQRDWAELEPGTRVAYAGGLLAAHGLWVVAEQVDEDRYTLKHPDNEWQRLNADRSELTPVGLDPR